jgi:hypothetical protein
MIKKQINILKNDDHLLKRKYTIKNEKLKIRFKIIGK